MSSQIKEELKQIYNQHADERHKSKKQPWKVKIRQEFLQMIEKDNLTTILDVGAGTGQDSSFFQNEGLEVTAIDLSNKHVKYCKQKGINAYEMDLYNLSFSDESFDALYSLNCLLHIPKRDLDDVLIELKRVLKTKGLFYLGVYGGTEFEGINEKDHYSEKRFFSFYRYENYLEKLQEHFQIVKSEKIMLEKDFEFHYFIMRK